MNTFLPYADIIKSVQCLDNRRLCKQRVEAYQILKTLTGCSSGWKNHPAVKMWKGYEVCLEIYMNLCIQEWMKRGFQNTMKLCITTEYESKHPEASAFCCGYPSWFGDLDFHDSHQSNLLRKDPVWYGKFNWDVKPNLPYIWPTQTL